MFFRSRAEGGGTSSAARGGGPLVQALRASESHAKPLARSAREFLEPRFGADFSRVRIHDDHAAQLAARTIHARAFTHGNDIYFAAREYEPETSAGRRLLAHELTHTLQQRGSDGPGASGGGGDAVLRRTIGDGHDLTAPRFSGNVILEAAFDGERLVRQGQTGTAVRLLQDSLVEMGYALPRSGSGTAPNLRDGIFGPETKAAVEQFQRDAGAVLADGIVGPETMGLFDQHDVSRAGARPPATTGPVPAPLGASECDRHFAGITFTLANQTATGTATAVTIAPALSGGSWAVSMRGVTPIDYEPEITIAAPTNQEASEFRVGFSQTLLRSTRFAAYDTGGTVATMVPVQPIKDGAPNDYHPIYVTNPLPDLVEDFTATGQTIDLDWPDVPADFFFFELHDEASCVGAGLPAQQMTEMIMRDFFRIWIVVQHRPSGCARALHHIDWDLDWSATVAPGGPVGAPVVTTVSSINNVTEPDGDGSPRFVQGGPVPGEIAFKVCL